MNQKFTRKIEDFVCENCNTSVKGSGYTNHCPKCLWSRHVDKNPGDRLSECMGMMEPIGTLRYGDEYIIVHQCKICGHKKRNKNSPEDDVDVIIALSNRPYED